LGQAAGSKVAEELGSIATDTSVDRDVRAAAIFALSQRPNDEGVPALIRIARRHPDPELRRKALFWLAQSGDERAIALFEEILTKH
jgi:HEAT repeat protein